MKHTKKMGAVCIISALMMSNVLSVSAYEKEETIYAKLDAEGNEITTIASEHLKSDQEKKIEDKSSLTDIFNVNGEETFTQKGESLVWDNKGKDIYYQGKTNQQLPISMHITYQLNGKEKTIDQMMHQKGKVDIRIRYENHETKTINGNQMPVPFVVTAITMLPTSKNSAVNVTNGKVISNGSNYIAAAIAAPGLDQVFSSTDINLNEITISYETDSFELYSIYAVATPSLLAEGDLNIFDRMDDGFSMMDVFVSSYDQIKKGGAALREGTNELNGKYQLFHNGISQMDTKSQDLMQGVNTLNDGTQSLSTHLEELDRGIQDVNANSEALRLGATQILNTSIQSCNGQLSPLLTQLHQIDAHVPMEITVDNYQQVFGTILNDYAAMPQVAPFVNQIKQAQATIDSLHQYEQGVMRYTDGVKQISENSNKLSHGAKELFKGSEKLKQGCLKLLAGIKELTIQSSRIQGATAQLSQGSKELYEGMVAFDQEGIQKLHHLIQGSLKTDMEHMKDLKTISEDYQTFTGLKEGVKGSTKFIMIVESRKQ